MSTAEERSRASTTTADPPLVDGQRLSQAEFMRRYELTPPGFKAELIGGVVHVPSPLSVPHGRGSFGVSTWLGVYCARTPGTDGLDKATTLMDDLGVPQPDSQLRILPECGGQGRDEGEYVAGALELVAETARSSRKIDLGGRRDDYERAGVREYIVVALDARGVHWQVRRNDKPVRIDPDPDGIYRSGIFPGLWLDPAALLRKDLAGVLAVLERGLATPEHAAFVARLADAAARPTNGA
jgi:Putative restriction endonuclease